FDPRMNSGWSRALVAAGLLWAGGARAADAQRVYFGTYSGGKSQGIYVSQFDPAEGALGAPELAAEARNASFLAIHPTRPWVYAVGEMDSVQGRPGGVVRAYSADRRTGRLSLLNEQSSEGAGPCHV